MSRAHSMSHWTSVQVRHNPPPSFSNRSATEYGIALCEFIHTHKWLFDTAIITFFEAEIWTKLPEIWVKPLLGASVPLSNLLLAPASCSDFPNWPPSLKAFILGCKDLAMPREPIQISVSNSASERPSIVELDPVLCVGMKHKKIHEVKHLSNLIHDLCGDYSEIIDVGSGKGYIAQALSHHFGYHVVGLEGNESQHEKADARFSKTEMRRIPKKQKYLSQTGATPSLPHVERKHATVNYALDYGLVPSDLDAAIKPSLLVESKNVCLMSLHACGDLSPCLLDVFCQWQRATTLVNVACCYHKIKSEKGFPMSRLLTDQFSMGLNLNPYGGCLELGTGCPTQFQQFTEKDFEIRINKLFFRSVLQVVFRTLIAQDPSLSEAYGDCILHVQKMKSDAVFESLKSYLNVALERCKLKRTHLDTNPVYAADMTWDWTRIQQEIHQQAPLVYEQYEPQRNAMKIYLALQSCLAPVVESMILFDRWQYLEEQNKASENPQTLNLTAQAGHISVASQTASSSLPSDLDSVIVPYIVPVFDQEESPRNLALIALKRSFKNEK